MPFIQHGGDQKVNLRISHLIRQERSTGVCPAIEQLIVEHKLVPGRSTLIPLALPSISTAFVRFDMDHSSIGRQQGDSKILYN